jgi:hypothetical protein
MSIRELTPERLRELLSCDPETCVFTWRVSRGGHRAGDVAGCKNNNGYLRITIDGRSYLAHRLVRLYFRGKFPKPGYDTDHIDGDKSNNRLSNLRHATRSQNMANRPAHANNKSGLKGASFFKPLRKWHSQIQVGGKKIHLGYFETAEAAHAAYIVAAQKYFRGYARAS